VTYKELAEKIATMTTQQQDCTVKFVEPYDSFKIHLASLHIPSEDEQDSIEDEDGEEIAPGEPYLD
jgi:hypothetical protein